MSLREQREAASAPAGCSELARAEPTPPESAQRKLGEVAAAGDAVSSSMHVGVSSGGAVSKGDHGHGCDLSDACAVRAGLRLGRGS